MDDAASAFCDLFPALYLSFCRRHDDDEPRLSRLTPQQDAVLHHLAMSGPLTVGETLIEGLRALVRAAESHASKKGTKR